MREPIGTEERLMVCLRFLASGDGYHSLSYAFRMAVCTISKIIPEVCIAIFDSLSGNLRIPNTPEEWRKTAEGFEERWNFPHVLGILKIN